MHFKINMKMIQIFSEERKVFYSYKYSLFDILTLSRQEIQFYVFTNGLKFQQVISVILMCHIRQYMFFAFKVKALDSYLKGTLPFVFCFLLIVLSSPSAPCQRFIHHFHLINRCLLRVSAQLSPHLVVMKCHVKKKSL